MNKSIKIPFSKVSGEMITYVSYIDEDAVEWKDNYEWEDELEIASFEKGRSSIQFIFISVNNKRKYKMSLNSFFDVIMANRFSNKRIKGKFSFKKNGETYMIYCVLEK